MKTKLKRQSRKLHAGSPGQSGDFFVPKKAKLILSDGQEFAGTLPKWAKSDITGEVVFNTGMTGYVESLTDPSYAEQILVFTYPLIGNYGVHKDKWESSKIHAKAVVISSQMDDWSHPLSDKSFRQWLMDQNVPILSNVDTRSLTQYLREKGAMPGLIAKKAPNKLKIDLKTPLVSISEPEVHNPNGKKTVILIDCGAKDNIVRSLVGMGLRVKKVPYDYDLSKETYDGVMLSNGPGDPTDYKPTIKIIKKLLKQDKPVFGICLGSQLMGLAAGAKTYKLKFGHRGHNQPCMDVTNSHCFITSQNHGYAIKESTLPKNWKVLFKNLNDDSVEGIYHTSKPFFSVQFHPEACPGPTDTQYLFERFYKSL